MPTHDEEHELDFVDYQEVSLKHVLPVQDRTVSKADRRFLDKAAKSQQKEERRGWGRGKR